MTQIVGVLTNASDRQVNRRDGQGSFTLHEVWVDGRGPFVARRDVYMLALGLVNQRVIAQVRSEQKGDFTNHYLDHVTADWNGANQPQQPNYQQAMPQQTYNPPSPQPQQQYTPPPSQDEARIAQERKDLSIYRQTATKVAATLATVGQTNPNSLDFWNNVNDLIRFYQTGQMPVLVGGTTPPAMNDTYVHGDDDIPFR